MKEFMTVIAVASLFPPLQAQVLFTYDFAGADPGGDAAVPSVTHLALSPFARVNVGVASQADVFASSHWTTDVTRDPGEFVSLTLQPEEGYELHLTGLQWDHSRTTSGPKTGEAELLKNGSSLALSGGFTVGTTTATEMFELGEAMATANDTLEFRFYGWDASSTGNLRLDNVSGLGTVVATIPEPSAYAMAAGTGLLAFAIHRRLRRPQS